MDASAMDELEKIAAGQKAKTAYNKNHFPHYTQIGCKVRTLLSFIEEADPAAAKLIKQQAKVQAVRDYFKYKYLCDLNSTGTVD